MEFERLESADGLADTTADARIVQVINQKAISSIPEPSTIALVLAGLIGLFGLLRKHRSS